MLVELLRDVQEMARRSEARPIMHVADVLEALRERQYCGPIIVHFMNGKIAALDVPNPIKIRVE